MYVANLRLVARTPNVGLYRFSLAYSYGLSDFLSSILLWSLPFPRFLDHLCMLIVGKSDCERTGTNGNQKFKPWISEGACAPSFPLYRMAGGQRTIN